MQKKSKFYMILLTKISKTCVCYARIYYRPLQAEASLSLPGRCSPLHAASQGDPGRPALNIFVHIPKRGEHRELEKVVMNL